MNAAPRAALLGLLLWPWIALAQADGDAPVDPIYVPPPPPLPPLTTGPPDDPADSDAAASAEIPEVPRLQPPRARGENAGDAPIPPKAVTSDELVPSVVIRTDDDGQRVEEYSVNGRIYMVRVTPTIGPVYYLFDVDGDGEMETREFESDPGIKPVHWKILEWD